MAKKPVEVVPEEKVETPVEEVKAPASKTPLADALRAKLQEERDRLQAELKPYREVYDKKVNDPELLEARAKIKALSNLLIPIENELAALVRAGGSKGIKVEAGTYTSEGKDK